jgi:starch synthase
VRALLRVLEQRKLLDSYWTSLAFPPAPADATFLPRKLQRQIARRTYSESPWQKTHVRPAREITRLLAHFGRVAFLTRHEYGWASVDQVYRSLDRDLARYVSAKRTKGIRAVYCYEDGAVHTFRAATALGLKKIYHLPIPYWKKTRLLLQEEADLHPAWAGTMHGLKDSDEKLARKDEEIVLADRIVVASQFTQGSLDEHFGKSLPTFVAPYGAPVPLVERPARRAPHEPLEVFYAGHLAQRKGIVYLIAALRRLDVPWRLTIAGPRPREAPKELDEFLADVRCDWLGRLPHRALLARMTLAHVFVFPSIIEGFGMVLCEAMAAGLPIITTAHTAAPDIMENGREGFIVPIRDPHAIATHLTALYEDEPSRQEMATAALACAARSGWASYEDRISNLIDAVLEQ